MAHLGYDAMVTVDMDHLDSFADTSEETRHLLRSLDEQGQLLPTMVEATNRAPQGRKLGYHVLWLLAFLALSLAIVARYAPMAGPEKQGAERSFAQRFLDRGCAGSSPEPVNCRLGEKDKKSLVFLSSTALETPEAMSTFKDMVVKLPTVRSNPGEKMYSGVKVLLLEDAAFLKQSFWDNQVASFENPRAMNYRKIAAGCLNFDAEDVKSWTGGFRGLDGGWAYDNAGADGLGQVGLDPSAFTKVSIFGMCASKEQAKSLFHLQTRNLHPNVSMTVIPGSPCLGALTKLIEESSILFANGGNPDMYGFVLKKFAPELGELIAKRVREGSLFYMGRSAGAMTASRDFGLTYEPNPALTTVLLGRNTTGLSLAGECALRPHIHDHLWDIPAKVYARATGETVVLAANGEGLFCNQGCCGMTGKTKLTDPKSLLHHDKHASRMEQVFKAAYRSYSPESFHFGEQLANPQCQAAGPVLLASSSLDNDAAKEELKSLLRRLPSTESDADLFPALQVLSLDDGAYLSTDFWDASRHGFASPTGLNYVRSASMTPLTAVTAATEDFKGFLPGDVVSADAALRQLGLNQIAHVSAFDRCATGEQKNSLFQLQSEGKAPEVSMELDTSDPCLKVLEEQLDAVDVVVVPSGNADFLTYVYTKFAPSLGKKILQRVKEGDLIFLGQGAGSIFAGKSIAATAAPNPSILKHLLHEKMDGLQLVDCALRPSWNDEKKWWDISLPLLEDAMHTEILGLRDGNALVCSKKCAVIGKSGQPAPSVLSRADEGGLHRGRLELAMLSAFQK